ncbi:MAG: cytochrome b5 [Syntrophaceae bacterium]|nr:cytochrome b5 [Syntrophaceae bacterium]
MSGPDGREYDAQTLADCDGSEGKRACVAVDGVVYDVGASRLWRGGLHMKRHRAGRDLTADIEAAPHGREVLEKVPRAGTLKQAGAGGDAVPAWLAGLLDRFPFLRRHPHPMVVHFPIVFMYSATFFDVLYMVTGVKAFEVTAFHCLAGGILFIPPAMLTGWFTWWLNYLARPMAHVTVKMRLSWVLLAVSLAAFLWRFWIPGVMDETGAGRWVYIAMLLSLAPVVSVIGYYGGELTFPTGKGRS